MYEKIKETADFIRSKSNTNPKVGIVLGSGLGDFAQSVEVESRIPYAQIPNFPLSTVAGHKGELILGKVSGVEVVCMQGRFHYYEGYTMQQVTFPIRVMKALGVELLIVTNASGAVNESFNVGDIMLIRDHINLLPNPLIGKNDERLGVRFPSMSNAYDKELISKAEEAAKRLNITIRKGVYVGTTGPSFETPAEYGFFRTIGGDTVGMSTVPEVIVAAHSGMKVLGMSVISNVFRPNAVSDCTHEEVLQGVAKAGDNMSRIVKEVLKR